MWTKANCTPLRDPFCALSHLTGALCALVGTGALLVSAHGAPLPSAAYLVYGLSMVALFLASAFHHASPLRGRLAERLLRLDHSAIYLLIAGTYTPICLVTLKGALGYHTLLAEYLLAAIGIVLTNLWKDAPGWIRIALYLSMGWILAISIGPLRAALAPMGVDWIVIGGLCYTIGCLVYVGNFPHLAPGKFSAHDLWHVFVLAGCACHYIAIFRYIALAS
ncbi:MAG: hemolysin III family protein [Capsulimonadaceae bacterium]|nr:hemolysin III family protein [Capsulimonadaceae bacterium]